MSTFPIDFDQPSLWGAMAFIIFTPILWNVAAHSEYHHSFITEKIFNGERVFASYVCAAMMFCIDIARNNHILIWAMEHQPVSSDLENSFTVTIIAFVFAWGGLCLAGLALCKLGVPGAYFADCFGFKKEKMITEYPFNIVRHPMYLGQTWHFFGRTLFYHKPAGVFLSMLVGICYVVALRWEDPLTEEIYRPKMVQVVDSTPRDESDNTKKAGRRKGQKKPKALICQEGQIDGSTEQVGEGVAQGKMKGAKDQQGGDGEGTQRAEQTGGKNRPKNKQKKNKRKKGITF